MHYYDKWKYYKIYYEQYGIKYICFRITNPYGPRAQVKKPSYCILNWFIRQVMENKNIIEKDLQKGAEKARKIAKEVLMRVRKNIGY